MTIHEYVKNGVAELVLDNPPVNAFTIEDLQSLADHLDAYEKRPEVNVVVFRSVGRGFCGGGDVKQVQSLPGFAGILGQTHGSLAGSLAILDCAVPVITAVHNYCIGVGMLLAGTSDIVLASDGATFVFAEADNGATAGFVQGLGLLPEKRLRAAMLTCENIDAAEFVQYGSIYRVLPDEEQLVAEAHRLARVISAKDPRVIRRMKATMNGTANRDLLRKYRGELSYTYELNLLGVASDLRGDFVEGRRGSYTGSAATKPAVDGTRPD